MKKILVVLSILAIFAISAQAQATGVAVRHFSQNTVGSTTQVPWRSTYTVYSNGTNFSPSASGSPGTPINYEFNNIRVSSVFTAGNGSGTFRVYHNLLYVSPGQINFVAIYHQTTNTANDDAWAFAVDQAVGNNVHRFEVEYFNGSSWVTSHQWFGRSTWVYPAVKVDPSTGQAVGVVYDYLSNPIKVLNATASPLSSGGQPTTLYLLIDGADALFNDAASCAQNPYVFDSTGASLSLYGNRLYNSGYYATAQGTITPSSNFTTNSSVRFRSATAYSLCIGSITAIGSENNPSTGAWY